MPEQEPAVLSAPEAAYVVTLTICYWVGWRKGGTWMWSPFICCVNCLYIVLMTLKLNLGHRSLESSSGDHSAGGLHKGREIWEAVLRSERVLRHREQLRRKKSAVLTYKKGKERISGEIYLQTLLIGTWKEWEVFSPSSSVIAVVCQCLKLAAVEACEFFLLFWPLSQYFRNTVAWVEYLHFSESNSNWCSGRLLWDQPKQRKLCTQC